MIFSGVTFGGGITIAPPPPPPIISAGQYNSYIVKQTDGSLYAWGFNSNGTSGVGEVGDNSTVTKSSPVLVSGTWLTVNGGVQYAHGIKSGGTLWGWGLNGSGQLGIGNTLTKSSPTQVGSLTNWTSLTHLGGGVGTMAGAINSLGQLYVWGSTDYGVFGQGVATQTSNSPIQIPGSWTQATIAYEFAYGIKSDGTLWTWGEGYRGALGSSGTSNRYSPVQVGLQTNWSTTVMSSDLSGMALRTDGTLYAWGWNSSGQLGQIDVIDRSSPTQIPGSWTAIAGGGGVAFGIRSDGTLWGWGANTYGELGLNDLIYRSSPTQIGTSTYVSISANAYGPMAVDVNNRLFVWGRQSAGSDIATRIGDGSTIDRSSPTQIGTSWV